MAQFRTSRIFDIILVAGLALSLWWAATHRTLVNDWAYFLHYRPAAVVVAAADASGLNKTGRQLLYRTDPQFTDQASIDTECDLERLGCLTPKGQAYILDLPDKHDQAVVTSVHEMLHLAYQRLPQAKKDDLAPLLDQAVRLNQSQGIDDEMRSETTAEDRRDEAHSLLGTEYHKLPTDLETYYQTYFTDRSKVLSLQ